MRGIAGLPGIGVIADDLTGALASAARLKARGLRTVVEWEPEGVQSAEALVINIGTRERDAAESTGRKPKHLAKHAAERLRHLGCERYELRVDSTLRGHADEELEGLLEGIDAPDACVLAVPAYPLAGRVTRGGSQLCIFQGLPDDMDIPVGPALFPSGDVKSLLLRDVREGASAVADEVITSYNAGCRRFVADAVNEGDLLLLAQAAAEIEQSVELVTVSSGAWLHFHPYAMSETRRFVLVALGASTAVQDVQFQRLTESGRAVVLTPGDAFDLVLDDARFLELLVGTPCLVIAAGEEATSNAHRITIARQIAAAVEAVLSGARHHRYSCRAIIATGGFTAQQVARELKAKVVDPETELRPLCPMGRLAGGQWSGLPVVLKGGLVGRPTTLIELVDAVVAVTEDVHPEPAAHADGDLIVPDSW